MRYYLGLIGRGGIEAAVRTDGRTQSSVMKVAELSIHIAAAGSCVELAS